MFNCLSINTEEITMPFPREQVTSAEIGQALYIFKGFSPMMMSGSHVCILKVGKMFSRMLIYQVKKRDI